MKCRALVAALTFRGDGTDFRMRKSHLRKYSSVFFVAFPAGGASFGEPAQYNGVQANEFRRDGKYRHRYDNGDASKIRTRPGRFGRGLTLGRLALPDRNVRHREAAQAHLRSRDCNNRIVNAASKVSDDSYQKTYGRAQAGFESRQSDFPAICPRQSATFARSKAKRRRCLSPG